MKDKFFIFIIGLLLGAVITAACFLVYEKVYNNSIPFNDGKRMEMMEIPDGEEPPEKPDNSNDEKRPGLPSENNSLKETNAKENM